LKIDVSVAGLKPSDAFRRRVIRRLRLTLSRFGLRIERVTVRLSTVANPLGGVDRCCRMKAQLRFQDSIAVETINGQAGVDRAITRLGERVERALLNGNVGGD
jgi:hypothetical protein